MTYLREDSGALPRIGFVTVAGISGILAGYRGRSFDFKKCPRKIQNTTHSQLFCCIIIVIKLYTL